MAPQRASPEMSIQNPSSQRLSNPFSSSASSPISPTPSPLVDPQAPSAAKHPWSRQYDAVEQHQNQDRRASSLESNQLRTSPHRTAGRYSYQSSHRSSRPISGLPPLPVSRTDPEKAASAPEYPSYEYEDSEFPNQYFYEDVVEVKAKSLRLLIYLSGPVCITSIILALWSLIALALSLLLQPLNMLRKSKTFSEQAIYFLAPPLKIHLSFIFAYVRDETYSSYSLPLLIIILLFAPIFSIFIAISAWTAAFFWFFAAIIGDPTGTDEESRRSSYLKEKDEDGKASVIGVRKWWKRWLTRALR